MNKEEAERLRSAIEQTQVSWLHVLGMALYPNKDAYELVCRYQVQQAQRLGVQEIWSQLRIGCPRDWIRLLALHENLPWL